MHPLVHDLDKLKDAELEQKIFDLTKKYFITHNPDVRQQMAMILDSLKEEMSRRRQVALEKMLASSDKNLDKLINVS